MKDQMQSITLVRRPDGAPVPDDFSLVSSPLPQVGADEVLIEVSHLSLDPYMRGRMEEMRGYADPVALGSVMTGQGVGIVRDTQHPDIATGDLVTGMTGWADHACLPGSEVTKLPAGTDPSAALGVLGMPGFTGWVGLNDYGRPKPGETLVVAAATGPVGSMVGQLARLAGLRTVAIAGGSEKCRLARETFGFDAAIDHRAYADADALRAALAEVAPDGVDIYFENVGGKVLEAVVPLMNLNGRIPVIGMIAWYNGAGASADKLPALWRSILVKRLNVHGLLIYDHWDRLGAFLNEVGPRVASGEITYLEDVAQGLEAAPKAFIAMLTGGNVGKQIVQI